MNRFLRPILYLPPVKRAARFCLSKPGKPLYLTLVVHTEQVHNAGIFAKMLELGGELSFRPSACVMTPANPYIKAAMGAAGVSEDDFRTRLRQLSGAFEIGLHCHYCVPGAGAPDPGAKTGIERAGFRLTMGEPEEVKKQFRAEYAYLSTAVGAPKAYTAGWWFMNDVVASLLEENRFDADCSIRRAFRDSFGGTHIPQDRLPENGVPFILPPTGNVVEFPSVFYLHMNWWTVVKELFPLLTSPRGPLFAALPIHDYDLGDNFALILENLRFLSGMKNVRFASLSEMKGLAKAAGAVRGAPRAPGGPASPGNRKKVLFVAHSIYGGGSEKRISSILRGLDRSKFEPHLCVFSLTGKEAQVLPADVPLHDLRTSLRPASLFLVWKLYRLIKELKPDKVFSVLWSVNLVSAAAAMLAGTPAVLNEATTPSESIKRYPFPALRKTLIGALYRRARSVVAVSDYAKADLVRNFGVPAGKIAAVRNAVRAEEIERAAAEQCPAGEGYVFSCGGLNWWKNYGLLIEAMKGGAGAKLVILGEGPLHDELAAQARDAGVDLELPGHKDNPYPYFKHASVFVLTSLYEGFPNVIAEAMACGTPVIAVDCPGGVREIMEDGLTGRIVPQNDPAALKAAILELRSDKALAQELAANARAALLKDFSFRKMLDGYEKVLAE